MLAISVRLVKLKNSGLLSVGIPRMRTTIIPSIEAWFMFPLIILPAKDHRVLLPNKTLPYLPANVMTSTSEVISL